MGNLLQGDLGSSVINNRPVLEELLVRFPATIELTVAAMIFAVGLGIPLGRYAARHAQGWTDGAVTVISLLGISIPVFVLGLPSSTSSRSSSTWLPAAGRIDPRAEPRDPVELHADRHAAVGRLDLFLDGLPHLILPAIALGSIPLAIITRITRASVLDVDQRGLRPDRPGQGPRREAGQLAPRHAQRLAAGRDGHRPPGRRPARRRGHHRDGLRVERRRPLRRRCHRNRDYLVVQSTILIFALIFLVVNLLVDILYAFLNPRIRYA